MMQLKIKFLPVILILFIIPEYVFAGINLVINNKRLVETTGGSEIVLSGDLIENGNGYLSGIVTSGNRAAVTQFAGLKLSGSLEGRITRITGKQYDSTGINFTRYYSVGNQNPTNNLITDAAAKTTKYEAGNLTGPFFLYTKNGNNWKGYGFGTIKDTIAVSKVVFPQNSITNLVISEGVGIKAKIFLEGPYNTTSHKMNITINGDIPLTSPYSEDARTASSKPSTAVDWVLVQLRDKNNPSKIIASRSAYLDADGNLIDDNATPGRGIGIAAPPGDYYVVIKHRNHLAVMTATAQTGLTWGTASTVSTYNFTAASNKFYGGTLGAKEIETGIWGMIAGDANSNNSIDAVDKNNFWRIENGTSWNYSKSSDFNLDGNLDAIDKNNFWRPNNGKSSQVP